MGEPWAAGLTNIYPTTAVPSVKIQQKEKKVKRIFEKSKKFVGPVGSVGQ